MWVFFHDWRSWNNLPKKLLTFECLLWLPPDRTIQFLFGTLVWRSCQQHYSDTWRNRPCVLMGIESGAPKYSSTKRAVQVYFQSASRVFRFVMQAHRQAIHFSNTVCLAKCQLHSKVLRCLQVSGQSRSEGELEEGIHEMPAITILLPHTFTHTHLSTFRLCPKQWKEHLWACHIKSCMEVFHFIKMLMDFGCKCKDNHKKVVATVACSCSCLLHQ